MVPVPNQKSPTAGATHPITSVMSMTHNPLMTAPGTSMSVIRRGARRRECPATNQTAGTTQKLDRPPATTPSFQQELVPMSR